MADIFISYSSKDRAQAEQLIELLVSAGLSVWIDRSGIDVATSWSEEIVHAIDRCGAFIVMLSTNSVGSPNVVKEVSLASEKRKRILPLDLEPVVLPASLQYALAGIQRAPMTNFDYVIRALAKLGLEATHAPAAPKIVTSIDARKALMILPFEDLSPTQGNGWFTDGIASEMVSRLSNIRSLRLIDWNTSSMLKSKKVSTIDLARDFAVRYFIQGQVRKFGDQIKIAMTLLDIETGDHLWQDSLKGTMDDIFDIQEQCAAKVVAGLELHLTQEEQGKIEQKLTENVEAYELFLKANEYFERNTRSDLELALSLCEEAVRRDPGFSAAYANIANGYQTLYRQYTRNEALLERAEAAARKVRELAGETARYLWVMSMITLRRGDRDGALRFALRTVETDPAFIMGYDALGFVYHALGRLEEVVQAREECVRLRENDKSAHFALLASLNELGESPEIRERQRLAAEPAIPVFERHVRLTPDDYNARAQLAHVLQFAGRQAEALVEAETLSALPSIDGMALYNLGCLYLHCQRPDRGMAMLRRSAEKGFTALEAYRSDPDLDSLPGTPEFEELMKELVAKQHG